MKKIFSIALAATLLAAGCQKTEVIGTSTTGSKMTFSTDMKKITKAGEGIDETSNIGELPDGNANLQANGFKIWAFADYDLAVNKNNVDETTKIYDGMSGVLVSYDSENTSWNPGREYYWPAENRNLRFFAVSAQEWTNPVITPTHGITEPYPSESDNIAANLSRASLLISNFKVNNIPTPAGDNTPAIPAASNDLMIADFREQNSSQNSKAVNLNFNHALTKVQFVFSTSTDPDEEGAAKVFVQKVEVKDLYNVGTLNVSPATGEAIQKENDTAVASSIHLDWGEESTLSKSYPSNNNAFTATWPNIDSNFPTTFEPLNSTATTANDSDKKSLLLTKTPKPFVTWFMLPQPLGNKLVEITYVINKRQFSAMFPLTGSTGNTISSWNVNQYVKYNISLTPDMILFDATVENWNPQAGNQESLQD